MSQDYYCSQCGNKLEPTMQFCPRCGTVIAGSAAEEQMIADQKEAYMQYQESRMTFVLFLLAIYSIPVLILGIIALVNADLAASTIFNSLEFQNWITNHPETGIGESDIKGYLSWIGGMCTASGIAGIITMVTIILRKYWIVGTIACFASTILCVWSLFGFIIGFFVSMMVLSAKDYFFKDYATNLSA